MLAQRRRWTTSFVPDAPWQQLVSASGSQGMLKPKSGGFLFQGSDYDVTPWGPSPTCPMNKQIVRD